MQIALPKHLGYDKPNAAANVRASMCKGEGAGKGKGMPGWGLK